MKKNIVLVMTLAALTFSFSACSSGVEFKSLDSNSTQSAETSTASTETANAETPSTTQDSAPKKESDIWNTKKEELPQLNAPQAGDYIATMKTTMGDIKLALFPKYAPKTVENFVKHAKDGYYDGVIFHRVVNDFMIQSGDPDGTGMGGESIYGKDFEDEFSPYLYNINGAISMANTGQPSSNSSQFFIVQAKPNPDVSEIFEALKVNHNDENIWSILKNNVGFTGEGFPDLIMDYYIEKGGVFWLDNRHTVFGQVMEGMDVVDKIAAVECIANPADTSPNPEVSYPAEKIIINSITIEEVK